MRGTEREQRIRAYLQRPGVQGGVAALILAWTGLTVTEFALGHGTGGTLVGLLSQAIAVVFAFELVLRALAAPTRRRFLREYWPDLIAVASAVPGLAVVFPAVRLLRLLRVFRMWHIAQRLPFMATVGKRQAVRRAFSLAALIGLVATTSTAALLAFEGQENPELSTFSKAFWFSLYSIFATQPTPDAPLTLGGRIVSLILIFVGLSTFALLTGTVSAVVQSRLRTEGSIVDWNDLEGHVIICGWNRKAEIIIREHDAARKEETMPVVVIHRFDGHTPVIDPALANRVQFLDDDFAKVSALKKAGIHRAKTCILLSDTTKNRSERDADARTILAALTVEKLNPEVYTCAELNRREYATHLGLGNVDDFVVSGEHSAFLLAQAALNRGVVNVFNELLTYEHGHKFCRMSVKKAWIGRPFLDLFVELKKDQNVTLIAILGKDGSRKINPKGETIAAGDCLVVIAGHDFDD